MKKSLLLLALSLTFLFISCDKKGMSPITGPDQVTGNVYFASTLPPYIEEALKHHMPNATSMISNANVVVGRNDDLTSHKDALVQFWKEGGIIIEIHPDYSSHKELWDYIGPGPFLTEDSIPGEDLLIAVHNYGSYRVMNPLNLDNHLQDEEIEEDELASPSDEVFEDGDSSSDCVEIQESSEYLKTKLAGFASWLVNNLARNELQDTGNGNTNAEFIERIDQLIHRDDCSQIISGTLTIGADDYTLCKIASSKPDKISRHSTYEYEVTITPFYAFGVNGKSPSDYYFITANFTSHNYPLFGTYKKKHGAVPTYAHAFYSENINWKAELITSNTKYKVSIPDTPSPQTTVGQMKYTSGFSAAVNVSGQLGFTGGAPSGMLTIGGTFTWNNVVDLTLSDQTIAMSSDPQAATVQFEYKGLNHQKDDNPEKAVPQILKSDQLCTSSWYWKVDGVTDNDSTEFKMKIHTDPLYGYMYRHCTWGAEGHTKHNVHLLPSSNRDITITVKKPNRIPSGVIEMKCTSKYQVRNVKVLDTLSAAVATSESSYDKGFLLRYQVPTGKYTITFDIYDPDAQEGQRLKGQYKYSGIEVTTGNTTYIQTDNATKQ
ncbi:MAG: hypothetical protein ACI395_08210 [Candidatus Cryptobacteroides sp.]